MSLAEASSDPELEELLLPVVGVIDVPLSDEASAAIGRLRKIHPPAHVIIVSPRHEIFQELINCVDILPEIDLTLEPEAYSVPVQQTADARF